VTPLTQTAEDRARIDAIEREMPTALEKRRGATLMDRTKFAVSSAVENLVKGVATGKFSARLALETARSTFSAAITAAMQQGFIIAGVPRNSQWALTASQRATQAALVKKHMDYLGGWIGEAQGAGRAALYAGMVDDALWRGMVSMLPTGSQIEWVRTVAESCSTCIEFARGSPYTMPGAGGNELPAVPRDGTSSCLANCKCYLVARGRVTATPRNLIGVEVFALGAFDVDPASPVNQAQAQSYQQLAEIYAWSLRRAALGAGFGDPADVWREIEALARGLGQRVRLTPTQGEILAQVRAAETMGLHLVEVIDTTLLGVAVGVVVNDRGDSGLVTATGPDGVIILDDDPKRMYRTGPQGRALVFRR